MLAEKGPCPPTPNPSTRCSQAGPDSHPAQTRAALPTGRLKSPHRVLYGGGVRRDPAAQGAERGGNPPAPAQPPRRREPPRATASLLRQPPHPGTGDPAMIHLRQGTRPPRCSAAWAWARAASGTHAPGRRAGNPAHAHCVATDTAPSRRF